MLFKDPLKELWVPFGLNCFAVFINIAAGSLSLFVSHTYWWPLNLACAVFSSWMAVKEFKKIPGRKADMQNRLLAQIRG